MPIYDNINDNYDDKKIFVRLLNLYINLTNYDDNIKKIYNYNISDIENDSRLLYIFFNNLLEKNTKSDGGKNKKIYKSTDKKIKFKYNNKIFTRTIYINNRKTKYLKINKEWILYYKIKKNIIS